MNYPPPQIVAHRGYHHGSVENSLMAFMAAAENQFHWAECDVWPSADGVPVVIHDETLDRTTEGSGRVDQQHWESLHTVKLRPPPGDTLVENDPVRSLAEVAEVLRDDQIGLLVEIKPANSLPTVRSVLDAVKGRCSKWMIQSFHEANLIHALACDSNAAVACLVHERDNLERAIAAGWNRIHLHHELLDEETAARLHAKQIHIGVWIVNEPAEMQRVAELGVGMVITDEPLLARSIFSV